MVELLLEVCMIWFMKSTNELRVYQFCPQKTVALFVCLFFSVLIPCALRAYTNLLFLVWYNWLLLIQNDMRCKLYSLKHTVVPWAWIITPLDRGTSAIPLLCLSWEHALVYLFCAKSHLLRCASEYSIFKTAPTWNSYKWNFTYIQWISSHQTSISITCN